MPANANRFAGNLAAMELGDWESVGYIRRSHISMWVRRMQEYQKRE